LIQKFGTSTGSRPPLLVEAVCTWLLDGLRKEGHMRATPDSREIAVLLQEACELVVCLMAARENAERDRVRFERYDSLDRFLRAVTENGKRDLVSTLAKHRGQAGYTQRDGEPDALIYKNNAHTNYHTMSPSPP
jgi:hypothetical protein